MSSIIYLHIALFILFLLAFFEVFRIIYSIHQAISGKPEKVIHFTNLIYICMSYIIAFLIYTIGLAIYAYIIYV